MDCGHARLLIEALHDGELSVGDVAALMEHLASCLLCATRHDSVRKLKQRWRACRPLDRCPDELKNRVASKLAERGRGLRAV